MRETLARELEGALPNRDSGVALLTVMLGLKLLEVRTRRDVFVTVFLGWFVLVTQFLYSQTLAFAAFLMLPFLAFLFLLVRLHRAGGESSPLAIAGAVLRLSLYAAPVAIVLFVLFPRLPGPLWSLPSDAHARTGLSGEMAPGRISELALSEAVAFRADFTGQVPPPTQRYWRGPVFEFTDGRRWWGTDVAAPAADAPPSSAAATIAGSVMSTP